MATTGANRVFVDTNVLASAILPNSPRYFHARGLLRRLALAQVEVWISRQVIREFLATMTRYEPLWKGFTRESILETGRSLESHYFVAEDLPIVGEQLYFLLGQVPTNGKQVHDANIAATMIAYDIRMPIATLMGPGSGIFARIMGPPFRQGHGARIAWEERVFARVMGPAFSQGHGAR